MSTTLNISIDQFTNSSTTSMLSNGWIAFIFVSMIIIILTLVYFLIKKERALQLLEFSVSALGIKLKYTLNTDEKIKLLTDDIVILQNEIKVLQSALSKEKFRSITNSIAFLIFVIGVIIIDKKNSKKK